MSYGVSVVRIWEKINHVNSLTPSDAIWRHGSWSTMVQVMACCLTAPSHNLDHCWLGNIGFHSRPDAQENHLINLPKFAFENHFCKQFLTLARGQWVKNGTTLYICYLLLVSELTTRKSRGVTKLMMNWRNLYQVRFYCHAHFIMLINLWWIEEAYTKWDFIIMPIS